MISGFFASFGIAPIAVRLNQIKGLFNRSLEATVTDHYEFLGLAVSLASKLNLNISHSLTAMGAMLKEEKKINKTLKMKQLRTHVSKPKKAVPESIKD